MKNVSVLLFITLMFAMVSCNKTTLKPVNTAGPKTTNPMDNLQVPQNFNWKTTQTINLTLTANENNLVNVTSKDGISYQKAFLQAKKSYTMKLVIPAYSKSIVLNFMGKKVTIDITSTDMSYQFN